MITATAFLIFFYNAGPTLTRAEFKQYPKDPQNKKKILQNQVILT